MWLWLWTVMAATPWVRALSMAMRMARSVTTKPKPQLPLMTAVQGASRSTTKGAPGDDVADVYALGVGGNLDDAVESWPQRLALTRCLATVSASASGVPLARYTW